MSPSSKLQTFLWVFILLILFFIIAPGINDKRVEAFETLEWVADVCGVLIGFLSALLVSHLISRSGGRVKRGMLWFIVGMIGMSISLIFGPIILHFGIMAESTAEGFHGSIMLIGMVGLTGAFYWLLRVIEIKQMSTKDYWYFVGAFFFCWLIAVPTLFAERPLGGWVEFWTHLSGFGLVGVAIMLTIYWYKMIGTGYKSTIFIFPSLVVMGSAYFFSLLNAIARSKGWWTEVQGEILHHGTMDIAMVLFLMTILYLSGLAIFTADEKGKYVPETKSLNF